MTRQASTNDLEARIGIASKELSKALTRIGRRDEDLRAFLEAKLADAMDDARAMTKAGRALAVRYPGE